MDSFCERRAKPLHGLKFLLKNLNLLPTDTPDSLDIQDDKFLEVYQKQVPMPTNVPSNDGAQPNDQPEYVTIEVDGLSNERVNFRFKRTNTFKWVMEVYCKRLGVPRDSVAFFFGDIFVDPADTPDSVHMEDGNTIRAQHTPFYDRLTPQQYIASLQQNTEHVSAEQ